MDKFNTIKELRHQVMRCFDALEIKQQKLKIATMEFVSKNKDNLFIFGLDSFQFQSKLIDYEYNDMKKHYFALNNRMYCEYYKLYKLILHYVEETVGSNKNRNEFPVYKDLEPFKQYDFEIIVELHKTILILLNDLNDYIAEKDNQLKTFMLKQQSGLNINNFVNTYDFDIIVIKQKQTLYFSYLDFFHNIHTKHFKRFSKKMKLMNDYLDEDIKFEEESFTEEDENAVINEPIETYVLHVVGETPDVLQEIPDVLQETPDVLKETPDVLQETPDVLKETPDVLQEIPDVLKETPDVLQETPDVLQETPDVLQKKRKYNRKKIS
jgi:hypothetical protein